MKKYGLAKPSIGKDEEKHVLRVLRSGVLSIGPYTPKFEEEFSKFSKVKHSVAVSSGTAGLHLSLIAAGIKAGDEVITSPFSFIASANAILYVGAKPVFVDIDPVTYNIDPNQIEKAITPKTKAILPVHIFGQSADMGQIVKIARKHKLVIVEDACESLGATYKGRPVGSFGESAVFAFYPNKQITTGEGGMVVTNKKDLSDVLKSMRNQGRAINMQWLDHERLGYNYRMDEMSSALGFVQIKKAKKLINDRRKVASWYNKYLGKYKELIITPRVAKGNTHTWFVYVVQLSKGDKKFRNEIIERLKLNGVQSREYLPSIHLTDYYKKMFGYKVGDFPVSETVSSRSLALPIYPGLRESDIKEISHRLISAIENGKYV